MMIKNFSFILCMILISCDNSDDNSMNRDNANPLSSAIPLTYENTESNLNNNLMLKLVNDIRTKGCDCKDKDGKVTKMPPVSLVIWNDLLMRAAKLHSEDMDKNNYFSHENLEKQQPKQRIIAAGYLPSFSSENIAKYQTTEMDAFNAWLESYDHCKNMMNPKAKEMGVARSGKEIFYWTQLFAAK